MRLIALIGALILAASATAKSEDMMNLRPYAVTLSVSDIDAVGAWYENMLGFERRKRKAYPEFETELLFLERDGFRVELIRDGRAERTPARPEPPAHTRPTGISQFAFEVEDAEAARQNLIDRGVTMAWELQRYDDLQVAFFFVRDPEGNLVQFVQRLD